jgi:hypothetical protein
LTFISQSSKVFLLSAFLYLIIKSSHYQIIKSASASSLAFNHQIDALKKQKCQQKALPLPSKILLTVVLAL